MLNLSFILIGVLTGIYSGFLGLGGGLIVVPILVYIYGLSQQQAQGTSLAMMVPPITLLAVMRYYQGGNVKVDIAIFLALGFLLGSLIGANFANSLQESIVKKVFGVVLFAVSIKMIFSR
jgi:uncharacterized membrane protein YfcA